MRTKLIQTTLLVIQERGQEEFSAIDSERNTKRRWGNVIVVTPSMTAQKQSNAATAWQLALLARWGGKREDPPLSEQRPHHPGGDVRSS